MLFMKTYARRYTLHIIFIGVLVLGFIGLYFSSIKDPLYLKKQLENEQKAFYLLFKTAKFLEQRFISGDIEKKYINGNKTCPELLGLKKDLDITYLKYNWDYMLCFLKPWHHKKKQYYPIIFNNQEYKIQLFSTTRQDSPHLHEIELAIPSLTKKNLKISLNSNAKMILLPKGIYAYPLEDQLYYWDTMDKDIYVDPQPISWAQIRDWNPKLIPQYVMKNFLWAQSASFLTKDQMQNYCQSRNLDILWSHIFYAYAAPKKIIKPKTAIVHEDYSQVLLNLISWSGFWLSKKIPMEYTHNMFDSVHGVLTTHATFDVLLKQKKNLDELDFTTAVTFRCMQIQENSL